MDFRFQRSKSWAEIENQLKPLSNKQKGDIFEKICEYYLLSEKVYEIKKIYTYGTYPRAVIEKLGLVNQIDKGADLVAERENGELWIIQCKFRSNRKEVVTYAELSTALAISDKADFRLIMANTESLPEIVHARGKIGTVLVDSFTGKDEKFWEGFFAWLHGNKIEKVEINPHDYQIEAIEKSKEYFGSKDRGQIVMACGTGKSYVSYWIADAIGAKEVLVMVPSLALLRQLLGDWTTANKGKSFEYLCVCSDKSVVGSVDEDSLDTHLYELDVPVTTKSGEVIKFLERKSEKKMRVIFSTYQSSDVICESLKSLKEFKFDLAVCDEAHRTAGIGDMLFSKVLSDVNIPCRKRLFLTATPRIYSQGIIKRGERQDIELCSMDDEITYGVRIYYLSFGEAIQRKLLTDYRVLAIGVNDTDFHQFLKKDELISLKEKEGFSARAYDLATKIALVKATKQYGLTHTITFHVRVNFAQHFVEGDHSVKHLFEDKSIFFGHVNGKMSSGERASTLDTFRNASRGIISNARCLTEGVDVKAIDSVYFVDPKYNVIDIVQATGRAVRLYPGKKLGYVIVPVLINEDQDEEEVLNSSSFDQVWKVIKAMMSQDERLEQIISKVRRYEGEEAQGGTRREEIEQLYIKLREKAEFFDLPKKFDLEKFENHLYLRLVDTNGRNWDYMIGRLIEWVKENPNRWPSQTEKNLEDKRLGRWCNDIRVAYKRRHLSEERIKELEEIGFQWDLSQDNWPDIIVTLKAFRLRNPNRWPRGHVKDSEEKKLGRWCRHSRAKYKKGQLSEERIKELEGIGFQWTPKENLWTEGILALKEFRLKNPDRWPGKSDGNQAEKKLAVWCGGRRKEYKNNLLNKDRLKELEDLGFKWDLLVDNWSNAISELKEFKLRYPDRWPSSAAKDLEEQKLGSWCTSRRIEYKKGQLSEERVIELEILGFQWDPLMDQWNNTVAELKEYRLKNPDRWPSKTEKNRDNQKLGRWCSSKKTAYKKRQLSVENIKELEDLGFSFSNMNIPISWADRVLELKEFRSKNPDRWPSQTAKNKEEKDLGIWCSRRRQEYGKGQLNDENIKELEGLGFQWALFLDNWANRISALKEFRSKNPDCWPNAYSKNPEEKKLGNWCNSRRTKYKKSLLTIDQIKELEDLGFLLEPLQVPWCDRILELKEFRLKNPDQWPSASSKDPEEKKLGVWCNSRRVKYNKDLLSADQIGELEGLGFPLNNIQLSWVERFSALQEFRSDNPDRWPSPSAKKPEEKKLGSWCVHSRGDYKKGLLNEERIKKLESIGFQWDPVLNQWIEGILALKEFRLKNPDQWPSASSKDFKEKKLGVWCSGRRREYRKGLLKAERIKELEILGFQWENK